MELPSAMAEICVSIGLDKSIIALQDRPNPEVYNAATDVLDLLSI